MTRVILLVFFLNACSLESASKKLSVSDPKLSDNLTIEEFEIKLKEYALGNEYPNIDN
tara:strand:- start:934 stop:1107 length:174 start_codon:yes stop_codon:yes gene_type:complete